MTRELDIEYTKMCGKCKKAILEKNLALVERLKNNNSLRVVEKLTGIPRSTLADMSESKCFRTFGNKVIAIENAVKVEVDTTELSKRLKETGQLGGPENPRGKKAGGVL